jgi:hypothetical protein
MKLSELKVGDKVELRSVRVDYTFRGVVKELEDGSKLVAREDGAGYVVSEEFDHIWKVRLI